MQLMTQDVMGLKTFSITAQPLYHFEPAKLVSHLKAISPACAEAAVQLELPVFRDYKLAYFETVPDMAHFTLLHGKK